jgi:hypothetical protein
MMTMMTGVVSEAAMHDGCSVILSMYVRRVPVMLTMMAAIGSDWNRAEAPTILDERD